MTQVFALANFYVQISSSHIFPFQVCITTSVRMSRLLSAGRCLVVYVPLSSETISGSHRFSWSFPVQVQLPLSLPVYVLQSTVSPLFGLPDPPIAFDWDQFRLGV